MTGADAITGKSDTNEPIIVTKMGVPVTRSVDGGRSIRVRGGRAITALPCGLVLARPKA